MRAERFGIPKTEEERAAERAKRFAADGKDAAPAAKKPASNGAGMDDKMKARAARFGVPTK